MSSADKLRRLWLRIPMPAYYCRGLCVDSCGPIGLTALERSVAEAAGGPRPVGAAVLRCGYLDDNGRCSIYQSRPTVCRLYGAVDNLRCSHGCVPPLTAAQGRDIMAELFRLDLED